MVTGKKYLAIEIIFSKPENLEKYLEVAGSME